MKVKLNGLIKILLRPLDSTIFWCWFVTIGVSLFFIFDGRTYDGRILFTPDQSGFFIAGMLLVSVYVTGAEFVCWLFSFLLKRGAVDGRK